MFGFYLTLYLPQMKIVWVDPVNVQIFTNLTNLGDRSMGLNTQNFSHLLQLFRWLPMDSCVIECHKTVATDGCMQDREMRQGQGQRLCLPRVNRLNGSKGNQHSKWAAFVCLFRAFSVIHELIEFLQIAAGQFNSLSTHVYSHTHAHTVMLCNTSRIRVVVSL